jgi:dTDP-4-dehydrorhamnose reductase
MAGNKKILVTGAGGLLGSEFRALALNPPLPGISIIPKTRQELDITDPGAVGECFAQIGPHFVINCAGYTHVDQAELDTEGAEKVNVFGAQTLAEACEKSGAKLVHYSTHFVFDGEKSDPYVESDKAAPLNVYGKTKLKGEKRIQSLLPAKQHLILRVSWLYGRNGKNFIHSLWRLSKTAPEVRVVHDQVAAPNPGNILARKTLDLLERGSGLFHFSCSGSCSRYELITFLFRELNSPCKVIPVTSSEFPAPAKRPIYSVIGSERTDLAKIASLPHWREALRSYLRETQWN